MQTTTQTLVKGQPMPRHRWFHISMESIAFFVLILICLTTGATVSRTLWPQYEKVIIPVVSRDEAEVQKAAQVMLIKMLKESWGGVLHIKDNVATTVRSKRAALGNKKGFEDLKNGEYKILVYLVYQNAAHGVFFDSQNNLWPFIWNKGATDPPSENPGTIRITAKKIGVVGAQ